MKPLSENKDKDKIESDLAEFISFYGLKEKIEEAESKDQEKLEGQLEKAKTMELEYFYNSSVDQEVKEAKLEHFRKRFNNEDENEKDAEGNTVLKPLNMEDDDEEENEETDLQDMLAKHLQDD